MSSQFGCGRCFLCGGAARIKETDHGNSQVCLCGNSNCGDTESTLSVLPYLRKHPEVRKKLQEMALRARREGCVLYLCKDNVNSVSCRVISKR